MGWLDWVTKDRKIEKQMREIEHVRWNEAAQAYQKLREIEGRFSEYFLNATTPAPQFMNDQQKSYLHQLTKAHAEAWETIERAMMGSDGLYRDVLFFQLRMNALHLSAFGRNADQVQKDLKRELDTDLSRVKTQLKVIEGEAQKQVKVLKEAA
jgi:hypothetical protein